MESFNGGGKLPITSKSHKINSFKKLLVSTNQEILVLLPRQRSISVLDNEIDMFHIVS